MVRDYNEAIDFYVHKLGFQLVEDTKLTDEKRWVVVRPSDTETSGLLLAKAANQAQEKYVGNQTGGRVFLFIHTDNFDEYFQHLVKNGVVIARQPSVEVYGTVAVIEDLYGNLIDVIQPG